MPSPNYKKRLSEFMMVESVIEGYFAAHLSAYTGQNWRSMINQSEDIGNSYYMVSVQLDGSVDTLAPSAQTQTGQPERCIYNVTLQLAICSTVEDIDRSDKLNNLNLHHRKIGMARAAMLHGSLTAQTPCPVTEIIGWISSGPTQTQVDENEDILTLLPYSFQIGYREDAWPTA